MLGADNQIPADATASPSATTRARSICNTRSIKAASGLSVLPEIARDVKAGAVVNFVPAGGSSKSARDRPTKPTPTSITLYDLLDGIKSNSALFDVDGVVANDRSPTGMASHELLTRTDAHFQPSTGSGSTAATGFVDITVAGSAGTELIVATCRVVSPVDDPLASVGRERWELKGSLSGELGHHVDPAKHSRTPPSA